MGTGRPKKRRKKDVLKPRKDAVEKIPGGPEIPARDEWSPDVTGEAQAFVNAGEKQEKPIEEMSVPSRAAYNAERQSMAWKLRKEGKSYTEIGEAMGITKQTARMIVRRSFVRLMKESFDAAKDVRTLDLHRLDMLQDAIWMKAMDGNFGAIDRVLNIMTRRSRLLGLDAAQKVEVEHMQSSDAGEYSEESLRQIIVDAKMIRSVSKKVVETKPSRFIGVPKKAPGPDGGNGGSVGS